jgi:hypothetical protein
VVHVCWLVLVVLLGVAVAAVHHQSRIEILGCQLLPRLFETLCVVVGALLPTLQNHKAVTVARGTDNRNHARLGNGEEVVGVLYEANYINGDIKTVVGTVLETHGEGET